jgi:hypothetical protein
MSLPTELTMPPIYDPLNLEGNQTNGVWPFSLRWEDTQLMQARLAQGFGGTDLVVLGPPQALERGIADMGIRALVPIVEMAQTLQVIDAGGLTMPEPIIFAPCHINAFANGVDEQQNQTMAEQYGQLARAYFAAFHPDLPSPQLVTDKPQGVAMIAEQATVAKDKLSSTTLAVLLQMAGNHGETPNPERAAAYFLAHFHVYGQPHPDYAPLEHPLMVVPQSESTFHDLMTAETANLGMEWSSEAGSADGRPVIGYSDVLTTPHYYPHRGEPNLAKCTNQWPTRNQLSRAPGLNGLARDEISASIGLIETDIGGRQNIPELQGILANICHLIGV